jgi:hypothetical protein
VSNYIDQLYERTQNGAYVSMRQLLDALSVGAVEESESLQSRVSRLTASSVTWSPQKSVETRRLRATLMAGFSVFVFGWLGWQLLTNNFEQTDGQIAVLSSPLPSIETSLATGLLADVTSATIYDPLGDGVENEELALFAFDGELSTSWNTSNYRNADMSGKSGVGILFDLGVEKDVYSIEIDFTSIGHNAEIYVTNSTEPDFTSELKFGDADPTVSSSEISVTDPVSGRYVLVWLTPDLPGSDSGEFQGGISEIRVRL